jgi:hypothetical protein
MNTTESSQREPAPVRPAEAGPTRDEAERERVQREIERMLRDGEVPY